MSTFAESIIVALVMGTVGLGIALVGWFTANPDIVDVIGRGDEMLSLSIVGSAFLIVGAISYLTFRINELIEAIRREP